MDRQEITTTGPPSGQVRTLVVDVKDTSVEAGDNGGVGDIEPYFGHGFTAFRSGWRRP